MRQIQSAPLPPQLHEPEEIDGRYLRPAEFLAFIFQMKMTVHPGCDGVGRTAK